MDGDVTYWTWVSHKMEQPIVTGMRTNSCSVQGNCVMNKGRGCAQFQTCCINDVRNDDYLNSWMDRGHLVPNQILGDLYGTSVSSFSMCNIGPQTKKLNQYYWLRLEGFLNCLSKYRDMNILAGPLFDNDPESHCLCFRNLAGVNSCAECDAQIEASGGRTIRNSIPMPRGYWKVVTMKDPRSSDTLAWTWIFTEAQDCEDSSKGIKDPTCSGGSGWDRSMGESIKEALRGEAGIREIERNLSIKFPTHWKHQTGCEMLNTMFEGSCKYTCQ